MTCAYQGTKKKCYWDVAIAERMNGDHLTYFPLHHVADYDNGHAKYLDGMSFPICAMIQREREDALRMAELAKARKIRYTEAILAKASDISRAKS
jgi:hypothetical protein